MWFVIGVGVTFAVIIGFAAFIDWRTRRAGRRPASSGNINMQVRNVHREMWRTRLRGTKLEQLFSGDTEPKPKPGEPRYGAPSQTVYTAKKNKRPHDDYRD